MSGTNFSPRFFPGYQPSFQVKTGVVLPELPKEEALLTAKTSSVASRVFSAMGSAACKVCKAFAVTAVFLGTVAASPVLLPVGLGSIVAMKCLSGAPWGKVAAYALSICFCQFKNIIGLANYRWSDRIDGHITLGGLPLQGQVEGLKKEGIKHVISMNENFELNTATLTSDPVRPSDWSEHGLKFMHYSAPDFLPVPLETIQKAVDAIDDAVVGNEQVYVHCKAGVGRSATVVICYCIQHKGMTAQEAIRFVQRQRPSTNLNQKQLNQIYEFEKSLQLKQLRNAPTSIKEKILYASRVDPLLLIKKEESLDASRGDPLLGTEDNHILKLNRAISLNLPQLRCSFTEQDKDAVLNALKGDSDPIGETVLSALSDESKKEIFQEFSVKNTFTHMRQVLRAKVPQVQWSNFNNEEELRKLIKTKIGFDKDPVTTICYWIEDKKMSAADAIAQMKVLIPSIELKREDQTRIKNCERAAKIPKALDQVENLSSHVNNDRPLDGVYRDKEQEDRLPSTGAPSSPGSALPGSMIYPIESY